jgi:hypothetical protein
MTHKLVPPNNHRRNIAKRAIQTFKNHFILILSGVDDRFPLSLWCHLVKPTEITINLLQQSNVTPKVSAYVHVHGQHDYMKHPFAPLGCAVMAHVKPKNRRTWDTHAETAFNIGTAMEHHQCFHVYIVKTRATRVSDRVFFKHQYITNPQIMLETLVIKAAAELTNVLKGTVSRDGKTLAALQKVSSLFTKIAAAKAATTRARDQTHPTVHQPVPLPRVGNRPPTQEDLVPRVPTGPTEADCCVRQVGDTIQLTKDVTPLQGYHEPHSAKPNYITQDESDEPRRGYNTQSRTTSIMQEAMLACINITEPQFKILPANLAA